MRTFWNTIKGTQFIWNLFETVIFVLIFSFVNTLVGGDDADYASMLAGGALFVAISSQRRLDNQ